MTKPKRKIKGHNDQPKQPEGEQCQRCKEWGDDRRTLWQACMFAMDELAVPSVGSGIVVRRNEVNVEITEEEWFNLVRPSNQPKRNYNDNEK